MQNLNKSISECLILASKTLKVLRAIRKDVNFELFYQNCSKHTEMHACLYPLTLTRRRQRGNYQEVQHHFIVDSYEGNDENLEI